jgi:5-methyltetrahydropteroyltriglutamate--homocysteine methyltransferase
MSITTDRILTTHVGSLVRPPELRAFLGLERDNKPYDESAFDACLRSAVAEVVRAQADAGVDIVSDGEFGKTIGWNSYVYSRFGGIDHRQVTPGVDALTNNSTDRRLFPEFWAEMAQAGGQALSDTRTRGWFSTGPLTYNGQTALHRDIENLKSALTDVNIAGAFLPVVAPASVTSVNLDESPYSSDEEWVYAVAEALREEYRTIIDAGLLLQVDDACLPWMYDLTVPPSTLEEYRAWATVRVDALNHALRGLPEDRVRYHICWGSFPAPHVGDVPAKDIIDLVLRVNAGAYLIEMANPRHEHEWRLWENVALGEGKILVPGVISHCTNVVEHPELVAERLTRLARLVGRENIMAGTDCGFAQGPFTARVHPSIVWAKLRALTDGAKLASQELWGEAAA